MINLIIGSFFVALSSGASVDCQQLPIDSSKRGSLIRNVLFQPGEGVKTFCLKLPKVDYPAPIPGRPSPSTLIEFNTVNKGNTQCGVLKMKVVRPNKLDITGKDSKRRCESEGPQPGCALIYTPGRWVIKYTLVEPCRVGLDRWDLGAQWALK